jgi:hypothetical protein
METVMIVPSWTLTGPVARAGCMPAAIWERRVKACL